MSPRRGRGLIVQFIPEEGDSTRSIRFSRFQLRLVVGGGAVLALVGLLMGATWWHLAREAGEKWSLQVQVDSLMQERARVALLAERLEEVEGEYERLRVLFGPRPGGPSPDLWLPPSGQPGARQEEGTLAGVPSSWPLTQPGFVTQPLIEGSARDHPGVDIAIPTDSYVRAAGAGRVVRTGDDPVYGKFVVLEHEDGYETVYAHASLILVERGREVRRNEVIALTGSTGRSTAPHLHFEVLLEGVPLDPLTLVEPPG